jgi:hypothetical protein
MKTVKFKQWRCIVEQYNYRDNNRTALELVDSITGEPIATATVNLPRFMLEPNEVIIKDYSENEGMYQALYEAGIIGEKKRMASTGFVECPVCDLIQSEE